MILHTFTNILVNKFFGNNLFNKFSYVSLINGGAPNNILKCPARASVYHNCEIK